MAARMLDRVKPRSATALMKVAVKQSPALIAFNYDVQIEYSGSYDSLFHILCVFFIEFDEAVVINRHHSAPVVPVLRVVGMLAFTDT